MICFYYALTAFACTRYFRYSVFSSVRNFVMRLLFPVMGGLVLTLVFLQTAVDIGHRTLAVAQKCSEWGWSSYSALAS